jgi:hypothetical protein
MKTLKTAHESGFTLIEALISSTLFVVVMGGFVLSMVATQRARKTVEATGVLNCEALEIVETVRGELSRSGYENGFPLTYDGNEIGKTYPLFEHDEPHGQAERSDVVYRLPADDDGDGWPDVEADGNVLWEDDPRAFALVPNERGTNDFVRLAADGRATTVARNVESVSYSDPSETQFAIPLDCARVDLVLSAAADGAPQRVRLSAVVKLANGGLAP